VIANAIIEPPDHLSGHWMEYYRPEKLGLSAITSELP